MVGLVVAVVRVAVLGTSVLELLELLPDRVTPKLTPRIIKVTTTTAPTVSTTYSGRQVLLIAF